MQISLKTEFITRPIVYLCISAIVSYIEMHLETVLHSFDGVVLLCCCSYAKVLKRAVHGNALTMLLLGEK